MPSFQYRQPLRFVAVVLLLLTVSGCGSGNVSGEVKLNGVPLSGGWVTLNYADGKQPPVSGVIETDGSYRIDGCPTGEVRVTIRLDPRREKTSSHPKRSVIPVRYADPEKTDLKVTVGGGCQRFDLDLKP